MQGRLLPARGGPVSPLTFNEVVKAAQAQAHREASVAILRGAISNLIKHAEGETANALRGTLASFASPELSLQDAKETEDTKVVQSTSPDLSSPILPPPRPLGSQDEPVSTDQAALGLHEDSEKVSYVLSALLPGRLEGMTELEKQAFIGRLLAAGRGAAASLAARGGAAGKVGRFLQRPIQSPIQTSVVEGAGKVRQLRSPLGAAPAAKPPPVPPGASGGPYRAPGKPTGAPAGASEGRGTVKPKSLTRTLLPTAALLGTGYLAYKGIPAAVRFADRAASSPMAYNLGHQQFMYGYTPEGQAQF